MPGMLQFIGEITAHQGNSWNLRSLGHAAIFTFASLHDMPPDHLLCHLSQSSHW